MSNQYLYQAEVMRKPVSFVFLSLFVLSFSCTRDVDQAEVAARVAKQYYDQLLQGQYESFVDGTFREDSIPDSYRTQLIENARMFVGNQQEAHGGICEVRIVNALADTALHSANVFLLFCFGDSTSEEMVVPMVQHKGVWMMK